MIIQAYMHEFVEHFLFDNTCQQEAKLRFQIPEDVMNNRYLLPTFKKHCEVCIIATIISICIIVFSISIIITNIVIVVVLLPVLLLLLLLMTAPHYIIFYFRTYILYVVCMYVYLHMQSRYNAENVNFWKVYHDFKKAPNVSWWFVYCVCIYVIRSGASPFFVYV